MCHMKKADARQRAQVSLSLTGVQVPVSKSKEYSRLVGSVCAGSILSWFVGKGGNGHRKVPSLILTAGLCLKHKAGWK